jgi:glycosyltransferase involved in cell wall biosynthesis
MKANNSGYAHRPVKVLEVVYSMNRGGVETWLMHVLRSIDRKRYKIDFVTLCGRPGDFDGEIEQLGSRIIACSPLSRPWRHARDFTSILERYGPYDVVHAHGVCYGVVLAIAKRAAVPVRIAHSHRRWSIVMSKRCSTHGLACSALAAEAYFGNDWRNDPRWNVLCCCEDFSPFAEQVDALEVRRSLRIPRDGIVIGHVGSFREEKNHAFLIRIARELTKRDKRFYFLFVGDGVLRRAVEEQVIETGLKDHVIFTGMRSDVAHLLLGAMDLFLFPSLSEGLGLALVEAQAAGLPCVVSTVVPAEAVVVRDLVCELSLSLSADEWAQTIYEQVLKNCPVARNEALDQVRASAFNLERSIDRLLMLYRLGVL